MNCKPCRVNVKQYVLMEELVLYTPECNAAYAFNGSAKAIWDLCDGKYTLTEISQQLGQQLNCVDKGTLSELFSDVETIVMQFHQHGLVTWEK